MNIRKLIASAGGFGLSPIFPGTAGAVPGLVALIIFTYFFKNLSSLRMYLLLSLLLVFVAYFYLTPWATKYWNNPDPKHFVLDEIIGLYVSYVLFCFLNNSTIGIKQSLIIFLFFRLFDTLKIFPANIVDKKLKDKFGVGMVLDDVITGAYAGILSVFIF